MGGAERASAHGTQLVRGGGDMRPLGKGKALRPAQGAAWGTMAWGVDAWGGTESEEVYVAPGMSEGVSAVEFKALSLPLQMLVMEAWFRSNLRSTPFRPADTERNPEIELAGEFGEIASEHSIIALARALSAKARIWVAEVDLDRTPTEARLGIVIATADPRFARLQAAQGVILARLYAAEQALCKLPPPHGGIGHNNPPDSPITKEEHAEASAAIAEVREQASDASPDPSRVRRAAEVLAKAAAAVGRWIWTRAEMMTDEYLKELAKRAVTPTLALGALYALDGWHALTTLAKLSGGGFLCSAAREFFDQSGS